MSHDDTSHDDTNDAGGNDSDPREPAAEPRRLDPTLMRNQPSLRTSSGRIWILMGALFAAVSLIPFVALIARGGRSQDAATVTAVLILAFYGLIVISRFAFPKGRRRLWAMAASMIIMAAVALVGIWVCSYLESLPA